MASLISTSESRLDGVDQQCGGINQISSDFTPRIANIVQALTMTWMKHERAVPATPDLDPYSADLARIVSATCLLPHKETVKAFKGHHVFPTARARKGKPRLSISRLGRKHACMFDDNTTPRWALLWAHGFLQTDHPSGWVFAHVWTTADDVAAYTNLANLVMVPEPLASLTDKNGPLTHFLQWHSWHRYGWKPDYRQDPPTRPKGYSKIKWSYLEFVKNPETLVQNRLRELHNQRARCLNEIM